MNNEVKIDDHIKISVWATYVGRGGGRDMLQVHSFKYQYTCCVYSSNRVLLGSSETHKCDWILENPA